MNRVLLATDGDFNVGISDRSELVRMIEFEQSYQAAAQFLQVVNQLNDTVLALL